MESNYPPGFNGEGLEPAPDRPELDEWDLAQIYYEEMEGK